MMQPGSKVFVLLISILVVGCGGAKKERPSPLRADSTSLGSTMLKVEYSSPAIRGRKVWGDLVPYGQIWRTGANDASFISTNKSIKVNGVSLDSGAYAIFTIPNEDKWQVILNERWDQWGTYHYDSTANVAKFYVEPTKAKEFSERMRFYFDQDSLKFHWENLTFSLGLE